MTHWIVQLLHPRSAAPPLRWAATVAKITSGDSSLDVQKSLISLGTWQSGLPYELENDIPEHLSAAWRNSPELKAVCLDSLMNDIRPKPLDPKFALETLLRGFGGDAEVEAYIARCIREQQFPFIGVRSTRRGWALLNDNFRTARRSGRRLTFGWIVNLSWNPISRMPRL